MGLEVSRQSGRKVGLGVAPNFLDGLRAAHRPLEHFGVAFGEAEQLEHDELRFAVARKVQDKNGFANDHPLRQPHAGKARPV